MGASAGDVYGVKNAAGRTALFAYFSFCLFLLRVGFGGVAFLGFVLLGKDLQDVLMSIL